MHCRGNVTFLLAVQQTGGGGHGHIGPLYTPPPPAAPVAIITVLYSRAIIVIELYVKNGFFEDDSCFHIRVATKGGGGGQGMMRPPSGNPRHDNLIAPSLT